MEQLLSAQDEESSKKSHPAEATSSSRAEVPHGYVAGQPSRVAELSPGILARYSCQGGTINMAGCSIDDVPIFLVRLPVGGDGDQDQAGEFYVDADGKQLSSEFAESLGVNNVVESDKLPPHIRPSSFDEVWKSARVAIQSEATSQPPPIIQRVIWCRYATGKVGVHCGEVHSQIAFHGWTQRLKNGNDLPPPFQCEYTGKCSYEIVIDDDQRITVPEAIKKCEVTGRSVVDSILVASDFSGAKALPGCIVRCAVSGNALLESELASCQFCEQAVSPSAIRRKQCVGCSKIPRASAAELEKYEAQLPEGSKPGSVEVHETFSRVYLKAKTGWTKHLIVLERESGKQVLHKQKSGLFGKWLRK